MSGKNLQKSNKKIRKIGLLSLSNADNYGAVLQMYSLYKICKSINDDIEVINYFPAFMKGRYRLAWVDHSSLKNFIISSKNALFILPFSISKKYKFVEFRRKYLGNTIFNRKYILEDCYDKYIVGSDQVWNVEITNNDTNFFLDFVNAREKKYSYAASMGISEFNSCQHDSLIKKLEKFNLISVRENKTAEYFKTALLHKQEIYCNIDPVFLTSADEWRNLYNLESNFKLVDNFRYALLYVFNYSDFIIKRAEEVARKFGLNLVMIRNDKDKYYKNIRCYRNIGPWDFLRLIDNASLVITDSFHGTAFSMIFHKEFFTIPYDRTNIRMENILEKFDMTNRFISNSENDVSINYDRFDSILQQEVIKSKIYLNKIF